MRVAAWRERLASGCLARAVARAARARAGVAEDLAEVLVDARLGPRPQTSVVASLLDDATRVDVHDAGDEGLGHVLEHRGRHEDLLESADRRSETLAP